jgi:uncharacterized DUF497 family protein
VEAFEGGEQLLASADRLRLEGIVSKRKASSFRSGPSREGLAHGEPPSMAAVRGALDNLTLLRVNRSMTLRFEWDRTKDAGNRVRHKVSFATAQRAWSDPHSIVRIDDREDYGEERFVRVSMVDNRYLSVCYTETTDGNDDVIRIISARKATKRERSDYAEGQ